MRFIKSAFFLVAVLVLSGFSALAQEAEPQVVDEVIAQVNDGVITLSRVKAEMKDITNTLVAQGKTPEAAKAEVDSRQNNVIASLITEELLLQKGKELGIDSDVEAQVNQRFLQIMKEQNLKTLDQLYKEMEKAGVKPDEIRAAWRKQFARDMVMSREVNGRVYWGLSSAEIKSYYETNKAKFTKQEEVELSEIFLSFAGKTEPEVREKAKQLVAQLRGGADFAKLAAANSDRPQAAQNKGKVGKFPVAELNEKLAEPIKKTAAGAVTDPIEIEEGIEIIRVDSRTAASSEATFDEDRVRQALAYERLPEERKKYMSKLLQESYIKISDAYRAGVMPLLNQEAAKAEVTRSGN